MESKGQTQSEILELKETGTVDAKTEPDGLKGKDEGSELINNKNAESKDVGKKIEVQDKEDEDEKKDVEKPLIDEKETVTIDLGSEDEKLPGEDTPTLPMSDKKKPLSEDEKDKKEEEPPSMFLHPIDTLRHAWKNSKSIPDFLVRAICIIFGSLGWIFCVGGVPFLPLVMLIIGSIFIDDCPLEPKIPVYLVVAGVFGLIQHVTALITKYLPKEKRRISDVQQRWCTCLDSLIQTFLFIWFIAGILVSSLAMISMGAACWDNCNTVPLVAQYLVFTGSIFFCILILLLLLTFCICTSSGDPKIDGALKIVYGVSVVVMFILLLVGTTILFVQSSADYQACNNTNMANVEIYKKIFNSTASPPQEDSFCSHTLQVFSYSVLLIFHVLLFFSLLVTFYDRSK